MCELKGPEHWPGCWREHHACALEFIEANLVFKRAVLRWKDAPARSRNRWRALAAMLAALEDVERMEGEP